MAELSLSDWYDHGMNEDWLQVYSLLAQNQIPDFLNMITTAEWKGRLLDVIRRFQFINFHRFYGYCDYIQRLVDYITLREAASLLEFALWKSKIAEQCYELDSVECNAMRSDARYNCSAAVVIPNVLSFLVRPIIEEDLSHFEEMESSVGSDQIEDNDDEEFQWYDYLEEEAEEKEEGEDEDNFWLDAEDGENAKDPFV